MTQPPPRSAQPPGFFRQGILFVLSAPSGAGKSTLRENLRPKADFIYSVSCTTRAPRPGEVDREDYRFLTPEDFAARQAQGQFLEHAEVYGHSYGTLRESVLEQLRAGVDVLLEIDVKGAETIRRSEDLIIREALADVFIMPPSPAELRRRLHKRGTETNEQIERRLHDAANEMERWREFRYTIISGTMEEDLQKFRSIMKAERYLSRRLTPNPPDATR
jgi:guanylate kinase